MSLRTFARALPRIPKPRHFLERQFPRNINSERTIFYAQKKNATTKEDWGLLVFGLGALSVSAAYATKMGTFSLNITPEELAKMQEEQAKADK